MRSFNLSAWAVRHPALITFFILALGIAGMQSFFKLGRAEDPNFTIKNVIITAIWPGATATEMQAQVADRIEKKLQELPYFDKVETYTKPGFSAMNMGFKDYTPAREVPQLFYQLRKKLGDIKGELPADLIGPNINDEYGDVDSILYTLTGTGADFAQLKRIAESIRQQILKLKNVTKVNIYGVQDERIFVEFNHAKLATLGISPQTIFASLSKQNAITPSGVIETSAQRIALRVTGALEGEKAVAETPVEAGGRVFRLGDIATVTRGFVDPPTFLIRHRGKPALAVGIVMQKGGNLLELGEDVHKNMERIVSETPVGIDFEQIADQPKVVDEAIFEFERSFLEALAIVLGVSFLSLGWRTGIVVALSIPLVLTIVFVGMSVMGIDLHRITLGALIIALGLLVDDAIIAVEMMAVKMEEGWSRTKAAAYAWESTAFPMLTGTLVTAAGFLPVGFANSSVGEYTGSLFWVVAMALIASWVVAVVFTPFLGVQLLPDLKPRAAGAVHDHDAMYRTGPYRALRSIIVWCVDRRYVVVGATLCVFAASVVAFGFVQQQFFPLSERPELFFQMRLPEGTGIGPTLAIVKEAEELLDDEADAATYTAYVGQGSPRFWLGLNPQLPNEAFAEIVIVARSVLARERLKAKIEAAVADGALSAARIRVDRFNFGPPVGFPVQFRVVGAEPMKVREIASQVRDVMRADSKVVDPHMNWNEQTPALRLEVDQERARALGLTPQDISQNLATLLSGFTVTQVREGIEKIDVVARAAASERADLGRIADLTVVSRDGVPVPLGQIVKIRYVHEEPILWRRNRDMSITVRADVVDGVQPPDATKAIWPKLADIRGKLPVGYRLEIGGSVEESEKGNASLAAMFPVMALAMLTLLMLQLQNFSRLLLVFLTAPLGIIGASLGLNVFNKPFGFVALLGLIALAGMIMRNTIILVDQIEADVEHKGHTRRQAIVEATVRRARPVILTALAAILAMIPLSGSAFWGPMAITIMGGLFVATFLTLLFLPALYAVWFRNSLDVAPPKVATHDAPSVVALRTAAE